MKLDRSFHWAGSHAENQERTSTFWKHRSIKERLQAAAYLNALCYGYQLDNPPKIDLPDEKK